MGGGTEFVFEVAEEPYSL